MNEPGRLIRELLAAKGLKPKDIERRSRSIAERRGNSRYYVSHATLAAIEAGSTPGIHKLFSLAVCCDVSYDQLLPLFGIETRKTEAALAPSGPIKTSCDAQALGGANFRFSMNFDFRVRPLETCLLPRAAEALASLPHDLASRLEPGRFIYAVIGLNDDRLADIIPPGSLVEVDTEQTQVVHLGWRTARERPAYIIWHEHGHSCGWCQVMANELLLVPHPLSRRPIVRFRMPAEATIIGRIVHVWCALSSDSAAGTTILSSTKHLR